MLELFLALQQALQLGDTELAQVPANQAFGAQYTWEQILLMIAELRDIQLVGSDPHATICESIERDGLIPPIAPSDKLNTVPCVH